MSKQNIEVDLKNVLNDLDGLSPKTSTYLKLKKKEKALRTELRSLDTNYAKVCKIEGCAKPCVIKGFYGGRHRYYLFCPRHRKESQEKHQSLCRLA